jgi:hypothetical protein
LYAQAQLALNQSIDSDESLLVSPPVKEKRQTMIRSITPEEYDTAPRVVTMQVTLEEAQQACAALSGMVGTIITERKAQDLLGLEPRHCKTVLMSLCHWRRLVMRRHSMDDATTAENGLVFEIVM